MNEIKWYAIIHYILIAVYKMEVKAEIYFYNVMGIVEIVDEV